VSSRLCVASRPPRAGCRQSIRRRLRPSTCSRCCRVPQPWPANAKSASKKLSPSTTTGPETPVCEPSCYGDIWRAQRLCEVVLVRPQRKARDPEEAHRGAPPEGAPHEVAGGEPVGAWWELFDVLHPESKQQTTPAAPRDALECVAAQSQAKLRLLCVPRTSGRPMPRAQARRGRTFASS